MPRNRSRVADIFTLLARNHTARAFKAHIRNSPAPPRITLYYNSSLFSVAFSALSVSFRPILRQTELIVQLNIPQHLSFARTPRQTRSLAVLTRIIAPLCGDIPPPRAFRVLFARLPPSPRQLLPLTLPLDTLFCLFRLPLFPQAVQVSAFLCVLVSCGTYVLSFAKTSTFIEVFARLCIFIHCVVACFSPIRLLFPSLRSFPHCRSVSDDRASTPLSYTLFRIPPSRTRAVSSIRVCILFPRSSLSSPIFSISFHLTLAIGVTFALFACTFL